MRAMFTAAVCALALAGCVQQPGIRTASAPATTSAADEDARIAAIVSRMSLAHKVGQLIQPQINSFTAEDMRRYRFGSYLAGGNGGPGGDEFAPAAEWLKLADRMWDASVAPLPNGEPIVPTMWGIDAVHGHTNVVGATIFPHNIGLGATGDADLVRRIGGATAAEMRATGIEWDFSPTIAVARDDRWGRTYESYSEDTATVARMGAALVEGLQGGKGTPGFMGEDRVIATAKHFFGDGGTNLGVDTGDTLGDLAELEAIHARPYRDAIDAGALAVMASFSSINGQKMHGNRALLTDYLRGKLGFDGLLVGDWNAHGQIPGCTNADCPQAINAGLDIYMVPDDWKALHANLVKQVRDGTVPMARLDEAVTRVLRVKARAGLLYPQAKRPSDRAGAGTVLGSPEHRALAREAVAKSQVILKDTGVLPLKAGGNVLVAGKAADSVAQAAGGWTLTWQGGRELGPEKFPGATSIFQGIRAAAAEAGGTATLSADGSYAAKPDVAIVVFGEDAYAEFYGDRKNLAFRDEEGLALLRKFDAADVPTVAVFLSGRPLWVNREINAADAFVASWLPGGEGAGVADVLYGKRPATGRLSFTWPNTCDGHPANERNTGLFPRGYGNDLGDRTAMARLSEDCAFLTEQAGVELFGNGRLASGASATAGGKAIPNLLGSAGGVSAKGFDRKRQEDARLVTLAAGSSLTVANPAVAGGNAWRVAYALDDRPAGPVRVSSGGRTLDVTAQFSTAAGRDWREMILTDRCLPAAGSALTFTADAPLTIKLAEIARVDMPAGTDCSF